MEVRIGRLEIMFCVLRAFLSKIRLCRRRLTSILSGKHDKMDQKYELIKTKEKKKIKNLGVLRFQSTKTYVLNYKF